MKQSRTFPDTKFPPHVLEEGFRLWVSKLPEKDRNDVDKRGAFIADFGNTVWHYSTFADWLKELSRDPVYCTAQSIPSGTTSFWAAMYGRKWVIEIGDTETSTINEVVSFFEKHSIASRLPPLPEPQKAEPPRPIVFIGHGRSPLWRDLKDHLSDKHGFRVEAYEVGARAGHTIRDVLEDLMARSTFACLLMTGEDELEDGTQRARQNVIHEIGLFQGRLGFARAVVLLEEGTEEFSNIHGINQIRFSKGNIREVFGDVLATLKREFPGPNE